MPGLFDRGGLIDRIGDGAFRSDRMFSRLRRAKRSGQSLYSDVKNTGKQVRTQDNVETAREIRSENQVLAAELVQLRLNKQLEKEMENDLQNQNSEVPQDIEMTDKEARIVKQIDQAIADKKDKAEIDALKDKLARKSDSGLTYDKVEAKRKEFDAYEERLENRVESTDRFIDFMTQANLAKAGSPERAKALASALGALDGMRDETGQVTLSTAALKFLKEEQAPTRARYNKQATTNPLTGNPVELAQKISAKMAKNYLGTAIDGATISTMMIDLQNMSLDDAAKKMADANKTIPPKDDKTTPAKDDKTTPAKDDKTAATTVVTVDGFSAYDKAKQAKTEGKFNTQLGNREITKTQIEELQVLLAKNDTKLAEGLKKTGGKGSWGPLTEKAFNDACKAAGVDPKDVSFDPKDAEFIKLVQHLGGKTTSSVTPPPVQQNSGLSSVTPPVKDDKANTAATATASLVVDDALLAKLNASLGMGNILTKEGAEGTLASFAGIETNENGVLERNELVTALNSSALIAALANDANKAAAVDKVLTEYGITKSKDLAYVDTQAKDLGIANANQAITKITDVPAKQ